MAEFHTSLDHSHGGIRNSSEGACWCYSSHRLLVVEGSLSGSSLTSRDAHFVLSHFFVFLDSARP